MLARRHAAGYSDLGWEVGICAFWDDVTGDGHRECFICGTFEESLIGYSAHHSQVTDR